MSDHLNNRRECKQPDACVNISKQIVNNKISLKILLQSEELKTKN